MSGDETLERAARLRLARAAANFASANAAASHFHWSVHTYTQHENGTRGLSRSAKKYAKAFKVSPSWLLTGEGAGPGDAASLEIAELVTIVQSLKAEKRDVVLTVARSLLDQDD